MSLTFYYMPHSTATATSGVIAELGLKCEKIKLDMHKGEMKTAEFLKINPNGKVPTIVHDGVSIWESAAITMYLGEVFGVEAKLYPPPGPLRGEAMKWITWTNVCLAEAGMRLAYNMSPLNEAVVAKAKADLAGLLKILDGALAGKNFLLGDYTLADTHLGAFVGWLGMMDISLKEFPNAAGWMQRCMDRPVLKSGLVE